MRRNIFLFIIITVVAFNLQAFSMAKRPPARKVTPTKSTSRIYTVSGDVVKVNLKDSNIMLVTKDNISTLIVVDVVNTTLTKTGKSVKLTDVKKGDFATVTYEVIKDKNIAKSINLKVSSNVPAAARTKKKY